MWTQEVVFVRSCFSSRLGRTCVGISQVHLRDPDVTSTISPEDYFLFSHRFAGALKETGLLLGSKHVREKTPVSVDTHANTTSLSFRRRLREEY